MLGKSRIVLCAALFSLIALLVGCPTPQGELGTDALALLNFGATDISTTFSVWNTNTEGDPLEFTVVSDVAWLTVTPSSGVSEPTPASNGCAATEKDAIAVTVQIDRTKLNTGENVANITILGKDGTELLKIPVKVQGPTAMVAALNVSPAELDFGLSEKTLYFDIANKTSGTRLDFTLASDKPWLTCTPASGYSTGPDNAMKIAVAVDRTKLDAESATGSISVAVNGSPSVVVPCLVKKAARLEVSTTTLNVGQNTTGTFTVRNSGSEDTTLDYTLTEASTWLELSAASGSSQGEADEITVTVNRDLLAEGANTAQIVVNGAGGEVTIAVTAEGNPASPALLVQPTALFFAANENTKTFTVKNSGTGDMDFTVTPNTAWLGCDPQQGASSGPSETTTISVTVNRNLLPVGVSNSSITIAASGVSAPVELSVTAVKEAPKLSVSPLALDFGSLETSKTLTVHNSGTGGTTLSYSLSDDADWLALSATSGTSQGEYDAITVTVDRDLLNAGVNNAQIVVTGAGEQIAVSVSATMDNRVPEISVSSSAVDFGEVNTIGVKTIPVDVSNAGDAGSSLSFTVQTPVNKAWLSVDPASGVVLQGAAAVPVNISIDPAKLGPGQNSANVTVKSAQAGVADKIITVEAQRRLAVLTLVDDVETKPLDEEEFAGFYITTEQTSNTIQKIFRIANIYGDTGTTLGCEFSSDAPWMTVAPASLTCSSPLDFKQVTVTVDRTQVSGSTATANLTIDAGDNAVSKTLAITVYFTNYKIGVSETNGAAIAGNKHDFGPLLDSAAWSFNVFNDSGIAGSVLEYTITAPQNAWLTVAPLSGSSTGSADKDLITVSVDHSQFPTDEVSAEIEVSAAGLPTKIITIEAHRPALTVSTELLEFGVVNPGSSPEITFQISTLDILASDLWFRVLSSVPWLTLSPDRSSIAAQSGDSVNITALLDVAAMPNGASNTSITITPDDPDLSAKTIQVTAVRSTFAVSPSEIIITQADVEAGKAVLVSNTGAGTAPMQFKVTYPNDLYVEKNPGQSPVDSGTTVIAVAGGDSASLQVYPFSDFSASSEVSVTITNADVPSDVKTLRVILVAADFEVESFEGQASVSGITLGNAATYNADTDEWQYRLRVYSKTPNSVLEWTARTLDASQNVVASDNLTIIAQPEAVAPAGRYSSNEVTVSIKSWTPEDAAVKYIRFVNLNDQSFDRKDITLTIPTTRLALSAAQIGLYDWGLANVRAVAEVYSADNYYPRKGALPPAWEATWDDPTIRVNGQASPASGVGGPVEFSTTVVPAVGFRDELTITFENTLNTSDALKNLKVVVADGPQVGDVTFYNGIGFAWVPENTSALLGTLTSETGQSDEKPQRSVVISQGYWMGQTEVTRMQWLAWGFTAPSGVTWSAADKKPANNISRQDAGSFVTALNDSEITPEEAVFMLPTEAEWENACRAGTSTDRFFTYVGDPSAILQQYALFNTTTGPQNVAQKLPNPLGLFDIYGNVREWCYDTYSATFYSSLPVSGAVDPVNEAPADVYVLRGGAYSTAVTDVRSARRTSGLNTIRELENGMRLVVKIP